MTKILVVDDEPSMREGLSDNLVFEGYQVDMAENGTVGLNLMTANKYDLAILDLMMPEMSGFDLCKKLRSSGDETPIIFLTAKGEEIDRVVGLELGADDYITKPFSLRELLARVKAILRRAQANGNDTANSFQRIGLLEVDFQNYFAKNSDGEVKLSHKEFEVLHFLNENKHKAVKRDDLLKNVWEYDEYPTTRTVDNFILRLRQKIERNPNDPKIILTVHGIGYKLI
ncbi:MAG: response regulator transcription factor [Cyclobacteriaceae bacterium]